MSVPASTDAQNWTEHTAPDGRPYYYNKLTKTSTWTKPAELENLPKVSPIQPTSTISSKENITTAWKEYIAKDGTDRKYYYNSETKQSVWVMPEEYQRFLNEQQSKKPVSKQPIHTSQKPEDIFMALLERSDIPVNASWEDALRKFILDPDYKCLSAVSEKKELYQQFSEKRRSQEANQTAAKLDTLLKALPDHLINTKPIHSFTRYRRACEILQHKSWWSSLDNLDADRQRIYEDHIVNLRQIEKEKERVERDQHAAIWISLLKRLHITAHMRWADVQKLCKSAVVEGKISEEDNLLLSGMHDFDKLVVFEDFMKDIEKADILKESSERQLRIQEQSSALKGKHGQLRDKVEGLLDDWIEQGRFHSRLPWSVMYTWLRDEKKDLLNSCLDSSFNPLPLFLDKLDALKSKYTQDKAFLQSLLASGTLPPLPDIAGDENKSSSDTYLTQLRSRVPSSVLSASLSCFVQDLVSDQLEAKKRAEQKERHHKFDLFKHVLKHSIQPPVSHESKWENVMPLVREFNEYKAIGEELAYKVFRRYVEKLKSRMVSASSGAPATISAVQEAAVGTDLPMSNVAKKHRPSSEA